MRTLTRLLFTFCMLVLVIAAGIWVWNYYNYTPWTRDGRVRAVVVSIAPDVSGWVDAVNVGDNQHVNKGDVLFTVNSARYKAALDQAEASAMQAQVRWQQSLHEYQRRQRLSSAAISREDLDIARLTASANEAAYRAAQAQVENAQINLDRTTYRAPDSGYIVNVSLRQGDYVSQGTPEMSMVKDHSYYVTGYFEETKIQHIHDGDAAEVWLMSGSERIKGHVVGIGRGISNNDTSRGNELLPNVSPTFTWVRLAQRIPVDVKLDDVPRGTLLSAGMTATVRVQDHTSDAAHNQANNEDPQVPAPVAHSGE